MWSFFYTYFTVSLKSVYNPSLSFLTNAYKKQARKQKFPGFFIDN